MTKILVVSDTWHPQVNGVVRTLSSVATCLVKFGYQVEFVTPDQFLTMPHPAYPEIRLALNTWPRLGRMVGRMRPDYIFIATEGPLGIAARTYCVRHRLHFTTSFTANFPKYARQYFLVPENWTFAWLRWFHAPADSVLVAASSMREELAERGFSNLQSWSRGVDADLFKPQSEPAFNGLRRPIWLYVGRIAAEKNLDAFLSMDIEGTKVLVGAGPATKKLRRRYADVVFVAEKHGEELARHYSDADVFVFPSKTDTFGIVMIEALASGTPVAAYPVTGPVDVITSDKVGMLCDDLRKAAVDALGLSGNDCRDYALQYTWESCAQTLEQHLVRNSWN